MQSTSQDIKWKSIIRVYRLTDNHENFSPPPSPRRAFYKYFARPLFKAVPSRISRWRPCFHYTAQCPVLDHTAFHFSLYSFHSSFSRAASYTVVPPFAKAVIFQRVCVPRSTSPQSTRTLISLLRVSRVRDSGVALWVFCYAHNITQPRSLSAIEHDDFSTVLFIQMFKTDTVENLI